MAKKTAPRPKPESKAEPRAESAPAAAPVAKPGPRAAAATKPKAKANKTVARSDANTTSVSMQAEPTDEEIRVRAYHRYLERGGSHGAHDHDWFEARLELLKR